MESAEAKRKGSPSRLWIYIIITGVALAISLFFVGRYAGWFGTRS